MAESTKGSNYLWWFFFTGAVLSGVVITLMLDGFFGTTKSQETLTYGVRGCAPSIVGDLGFAVEGNVDAIGLPRIDYIESTAAFGNVMGLGKRDRRNRRSVDLTQDGDNVANQVGARVMGANFTGSGPVPGEKGCFKMLKDYADFVNGGEDGDGEVPTDEEKMEWWENADNKPLHLMMCIASTYPVASTCVTHPHLRVDENNNPHLGFVAAGATGTSGGNAHTADNTRDIANMMDDANTDYTTYLDGADYKPCEQRTREECSESPEVWLGTTAGGRDNVKFRECVASSIAPDNTAQDGDANPYKVASVAYLVDKTDLSVNKALCRYMGEARAAECNALYEPKAFGHSDAVGGTGHPAHIGYSYLGDATNDAYQNNLVLGTNYKDEEAEPFNEDPEGVANEGGKFWARVTHQDQYIEEKLNINRHNMQPADIEFMSAFAVAAYARKISGEERYTPQNDDEVSGEQNNNLAALLDAIPGTCFSPGVSGNLLYQEGWGAAYFSLAILLVVAHLLWLAAAVMGDEMEMVRFNAKRAMSFFGILVGLIGLYLLFFTYGSGQGAIIDDDELRHFAQAISGGEAERMPTVSAFLDRLNHGTISVFDSGSFTNTATIQAAEALHFVILAFAIVTPIFSDGSMATRDTVFLKV